MKERTGEADLRAQGTKKARRNQTSRFIGRITVLKLASAGDADPGALLRRRRREVALDNILAKRDVCYLTQNLRFPYAVPTIPQCWRLIGAESRILYQGPDTREA
jgi:hypothetical protein